MEFFSLKPEAFGLDISDLSLKILQLKKRGKRFFLNSFGEEKIEPGLIEGGEIKNEEKLVEILKEAIKKVKGKKLKTKYVVASLPEEKTFLQVIRMPMMGEEDLRSALVYEVENYVPLPIDQIYFDFQIVPLVYNHKNHLDVLIAAVPRKIVDSYFSFLKRAGLKPIAFEVESQAIARALIKEEKTDSPVLIIDLGATRTSFIIFAKGTIRFTSSIPVSGNSLTQIIAKNLGTSFDEAEKLKIKYGLKEKGKIFEALIPALVDLVQQIKKCLDYYETHAQISGLSPQSGKKVSKVLLCGGGANLKGLTEFLNLELKIPVELGNPLVNVFPEKRKFPGLFLEKSLSFTTAIGLALREI